MVHQVSNGLCLARWMDIHGDGDGRFYRALILPRDSLDKDDAGMINVTMSGGTLVTYRSKST